MADIYTDEHDENIIRKIIDYGFNFKKLPKYTVLRLALAKSLLMETPPEKELDSIVNNGSNYNLEQVTGKGNIDEEQGNIDYDDAVKSILSVYHEEDLFKDANAKLYRKLLQRHIRRGLREFRTGWRTNHDIATYIQEELLSSGIPYQVKEVQRSVTEENLLSALLEIGVTAEIQQKKSGPRIDHFSLYISQIEEFESLKRGLDKLAFSLGLANEGIFLKTTDKPKVVGLDIPRRKNQWQTISGAQLRKWLATNQAWQKKLPVWLGQDTMGADVTFDLADAPHLLIGGTTGSGKSITLHALILSLLQAISPDQLKMAFIDPKCVELSRYQVIPHLYQNGIANSISSAKGLLDEIVENMEQRNKMLESVGVRNIEEAAKQRGFDLPRIFIIVEEMADLLSQSRELEKPLIRLAQLGRSAGIHLVLTTQRPDAATFTGLLRSNIPGRIALRVQKSSESKIILDETGAEKLLGFGDMIVKAVSAEAVRAHGAYISEDDISHCLSSL